METCVGYERGQLPSRFLKSPLGRSLSIFGVDAQKLGLYLLANPYLDIQGTYALPLKAITQQTAIRTQRVKKLLRTLRHIGFCRYDFESEQVSVPLVQDIYATWLGRADEEGTLYQYPIPPTLERRQMHA